MYKLEQALQTLYLFHFQPLDNLSLATGAKLISLFISCIVVSPFFLSMSYMCLRPLLWNCPPVQGRWSVKNLLEPEQEVDPCCVAVWCIAEQNSLL